MLRVVLPFIVIFPSLGFAGANSDHVEAAIRQFQNSTNEQRDGKHLLNIAALRNLRDVDLRPLFFNFTQHPDWSIRPR